MPNQGHKDFLLFFSRYWVILNLRFVSVTLSEFIFISSGRWRVFFLFQERERWHVAVQLFLHHLWRRLSCPPVELLQDFLSKLIQLIFVGLFLESLFCLWSNLMLVPHCLDYCGFIKNLDLSVSSPSLFSFFQNCFGYPGPLHFCIKVRISLSIST